MKSRCLILFLILLSCMQGFGQNHVIDSLNHVLKTQQEDTNKINTLNVLSDKLARIGKYDSSMACAQTAKILSEKIENKQGIATALKNIGIIYINKSDYPHALENLFKATSIDQELKNKKETGTDLLFIGITYEHEGNYSESLEYALKALAIFQEIGYKNGISSELVNIGNIYYNQGNYSKVLEYEYKALSINQEIGSKKGIAINFLNIGNVYHSQKNYPKALEYDFMALVMAQEMDNKIGIASNLTNIGSVYLDQGNYQKALEYDFKALGINTKIGNKEGIAHDLGQIGIEYTHQKNYRQAKEYLDSAMNFYINIGVKDGIKDIYKGLTTLDSATGNSTAAFEDYKNYTVYRDSLLNDATTQKILETQMSYDFNRKTDSIKAEQDRKDVLAEAGNRKQEFIIKFVFFGLFLVLLFTGLIFRSLRIARKQKQVIEIKNKETEDQRKVIELVDQIGQKINSSLNLREVIETIHGNIRSVMDTTGLIIYIYNPETQSLELKYVSGNHEGFIANSIPLDSKESFCVYSFNNKQEILVNDVSKEYSNYLSAYYWASFPDAKIISAFIIIPLTVNDKTIGVISVESFKTNVYTKEHLEILKSLGSFMSVALNNADAYTQLNAAKDNLARQKALVEEKNKDITDSINYAKRIQRALLKEEEHVSKHLPEHFILFKPKDIVSGDFYWALEKEEFFYFAAADCTGHGVPGGFMSMLGLAFLNEITKGSAIQTPAEILDELRTKILKEFKQKEGEDQTKDGMDISLMQMNLKTREIEWSGANNPLYVIDDALEETPADKQPIGYFPLMKPFTNHTVKAEKGSILYLFSDGYADQFGGANGKKFKHVRFKEVLLSIHKKGMKEQKKILNETFENWKGNLEQVDDVLVIGIRV